MRAWTICVISILFAVPTVGHEPPQSIDVQPEAASEDMQPGASDAGNMLAFRAGFIWKPVDWLKSLAGRLWPEGSQHGRALQSNGTVDLCTFDFSSLESAEQMCQKVLDAGHACTTRWSDFCATDHWGGAEYNSYKLSDWGCRQCPSPPDTCTGAIMFAAHYIEKACGLEGNDGTCASTACTTAVNSFTDEKVQLMLTGLALCTGSESYWKDYIGDDVGHLSYLIHRDARKCGLTAPLSPLPLDTCYGAIAKIGRSEKEWDWACGHGKERTPGTGTCASAACTAFVDSFTDANVSLMATGFASCTGATTTAAAEFHSSSHTDVDWLKDKIQHHSGACGLTAPFNVSPSPPPAQTGDLVTSGCVCRAGDHTLLDLDPTRLTDGGTVGGVGDPLDCVPFVRAEPQCVGSYYNAWGPSRNGNFSCTCLTEDLDCTNDNNLVCIINTQDYNVHLLLPTPPPSPPTPPHLPPPPPTPPQTGDENNETPVGAIVGGAVGVVVTLLIVGVGVYFLRKKAKSSGSDANVRISRAADAPGKITSQVQMQIKEEI